MSLLAAQAAAARPPAVIATIAPLHSLVQGVLGASADARLLADARHSPHGLRLKPSQVRALQDADVIFYVDETLEGYLRNAFQALPESAHRVSVAREVMPPPDAIGNYRPNLHMWLNPQTAASIAWAVARELGQRWPQNRALFEANAEAVIERLETLDQALLKRLAAVRGRPFVVLHDAYFHLAHRYDLAATAVAAAGGDGHGHGAASVRGLRAIEAAIRDTGALCVFHEPQFPKRMADALRALAADAGVEFGVLDALGAGLEPGPDLYFRLLENIGTELTRCLNR